MSFLPVLKLLRLKKPSFTTSTRLSMIRKSLAPGRSFYGLQNFVIEVSSRQQIQLQLLKVSSSSQDEKPKVKEHRTRSCYNMRNGRFPLLICAIAFTCGFVVAVSTRVVNAGINTLQGNSPVHLSQLPTNHAGDDFGAVVLDALTSPGFSSRIKSSWTWPWTSTPMQDDYPPRVVLGKEMESGKCWRFQAPTGHLGVQLSASIRMTNVTIVHLPKDLSFDRTIAPKDIIFWGVADSSAKISKGSFDDFCVAHDTLCSSVRSVLPQVPSIEGSAKLVRLGKFRFDVTNENVTQWFDLDPLPHDEMGFQRVIFDFRSNWNSKKFTCIYKVGVYGRIMH